MNFFDNIEKYAIANPEKIALVDDKTILTYEQLFSCLKYNQRLLKRYGTVSGEKIILKIQRQLDFTIAFLSLLSVESWIIPIPIDITQQELQKIVDFTGAKIIPNDIFEIKQCFDINTSTVFVKPEGDKTGIYHLTSGTTGTPKLCIRTLEGLILEGLSFKRTFSINCDDKIFSVSPLYHSYALGAALVTAFVSGACLFTVDNFIPRKVLKIIDENKISILIAIPIMVKALCNTYSDHIYDLSSLRVALVGAGAISKEVYNNFKERYGITLLSNYGSTETGGIVSRLEPLPFTTIGKPMVDVEIKLCNEQGERVALGEEGEVWVKCESMLKGYFGEEEIFLDKQGFFPMGDIAVQDIDNYLYIKGRKKMMINVAGKKVNPFEVEEILLGFPGVKECVVVGSNKQNGEEYVKAIIVAHDIKENDLRRYCVNKLSEYKIPLVIEFKESLPKNELGKIKREELAKET